MLDISPDKLLVLLVIGVLVLGPEKLPRAARGLAHGFAKARHLAAVLTDPLHASVEEPLRAAEELVADVQSALADPLQLGTSSQVVDPAAHVRSLAAGSPPDPSFN